MDKHNHLEGSTLKLKKKLTFQKVIYQKHLKNLQQDVIKALLKQNDFLTNTRSTVDSFINNLVEKKEILILHVTQFFTSQEAMKKKLELRNLAPVDLLRFDGSSSLVRIYRQFLS